MPSSWYFKSSLPSPTPPKEPWVWQKRHSALVKERVKAAVGDLAKSQKVPEGREEGKYPRF